MAVFEYRVLRVATGRWAVGRRDAPAVVDVHGNAMIAQTQYDLESPWTNWQTMGACHSRAEAFVELRRLVEVTHKAKEHT